MIARLAVDPATYIVVSVFGAATTVTFGLLVYVVKRVWEGRSWITSDVDRADASYVASGLRMKRWGEPEVDAFPMVPDLVPSSVEHALWLLIRVRLKVTNRGPKAESITTVKLSIGKHNGQALVEEATGMARQAYQPMAVAPDGGHARLELMFIFPTDQYGDKGEWNYSLGAHWTMWLETSHGGRTEFDLLVTPPDPKSAIRVAVIQWRRRRWWERFRRKRSSGAHRIAFVSVPPEVRVASEQRQT